MAARLLHAYVPADDSPIEELSRVSLTEDLVAEGSLLSRGAKGTVVSVYGRGEAYCVEFTTPISVLLTVRPDQIEALS